MKEHLEVREDQPVRLRRKGGPNAVDVHVGSRVRLRRNMLGLSQEKLGEALGITFQQVQKYERGTNRISASRLLEIARVLDVPVTFFFDKVDPVRAPVVTERMTKSDSDLSQRPETVELVTAISKIPDERVRQRLIDLIRTILKSSGIDVVGHRVARQRRSRLSVRAGD